VKVIGTHFNINGYMDDHHIKTTLLEGSVSVSSRKLTKLLKPGEQSVLDEEHIGVLKVDTDEEIAWKDGQFRFNNTNLKNILYQLERWYDIKVDYSHIPVKRFNGMVPRKAKLSEVLKMLSLTGNIQFNLQADKKLTVTSK
jgi:transmembrane sensor